MYSHCLRCHRSLGANTELRYLPIGRRVAFDADRGRAWVVCRHCQQWNLVPLEDRWEILEECARIAASAESRVDGDGIGIARTAGGLELLRASEFSHSDIANWRYGRRLKRRQRLGRVTAAVLAILAFALAIRAGVTTGSFDGGLYVGFLAAAWLGFIWHSPPRLAFKASWFSNDSLRIWAWRRNEICVEASPSSGAVELVLPDRRGERRLSGREAAQALASLLPALNDTDSSIASVERAVAAVTSAESKTNAQSVTVPRRRRGRRIRARAAAPIHQAVPRPWERLAARLANRPLLEAEPELRLALEMAVTEEIEQHELAMKARSAGQEWGTEEEIGAIADDLLVPESLRARLDQLRRGE